MTNQTSSKMTWIWIAAIVAVSAIAYFYWTGGQLTPTTLVQASPVDAVNAKTSAQSNQLNGLQIDPRLFSDPVFTSLHDYTIPVPAQDVGRANPFAPIDGEAVSSTTQNWATGNGAIN